MNADETADPAFAALAGTLNRLDRDRRWLLLAGARALAEGRIDIFERLLDEARRRAEERGEGR